MPSVIMQDIMQQFNLDPILFGQFSGIYYVGYALMHIPLGILLDRYGPKTIMPLCMIAAVIGVTPIIFANHWLYAVIGRCLIGMGSSGAILSAFAIIRSLFATEKFTRILSLTVTIGLIGAIYGGGPMNYICDNFGYKLATIILAGLGLLLAGIAYFVTPVFQRHSEASVLADIKEVFSAKKVWMICLLAGLMVGPLEGFADVWGKQFLQLNYGFDGTVSTSLISTIFLGLCFGAPAISYIAAKLKDDLLIIFIAGALMAICFVVLLAGNLNSAFISVMFSIIGVCCAYQTLALFMVSTYVNKTAVGLTMAVANMIIMTFGYAFHSIIGFIINIFGGASSPKAFTYGIAVIPAALIMGALGFGMIYWRQSKRMIEPTGNEITV
jgi:predicted MFS family arabinose efflux permease